MAYTLQDIRDHVRLVMDLDEIDLPDQLLDVFIREGSTRVEQAVGQWPFYEQDFTFDTVAGTSNYTFATVASDLAQPSRLRSTNHEMSYVGPDEADMAYPRNVVTSSEPWYWTSRNTTITVYPSPDAVYTINVRGLRTPNDWVADGAGGLPDLPEQFHNLLNVWALGRAYAQQEDLELASYYASAFTTELDVLRNRADGAPQAQPLRLNVGGMPPRMLGPGRYSWE